MSKDVKEFRAKEYGSDGALLALGNLGLSRIQSRVYLHLLFSSEQSARSIVESLRLDRVDVYRTLQSLQSLGLVEVDLGNPNRYAACPPSAALKLLLERKEKEFQSIKINTLNLEKQLSSARRQSGKKQRPSSDQYYTLKRGYAVVDAILDAEASAQAEIRKVVNSLGMGFHILFGLAKVEKKLLEKGVKIRLITDRGTRAVKNYSRIANVRFAGDLSNSLRYIIVDDRLAVLSLAPNVTDEKDSVALFTNSVTLIQALSSFYDKNWNAIRP